MRVVVLLVALAVVGCTSADHSPRLVQRSMTANDTPVGGGFPARQTPNGDPFNRAPDRGQLQLDWRGDNGAPETRIDGGSPDSRVYRRTQ